MAVNKELVKAEGLKQKIKKALEGLTDSGRKKINLTDPDSAVMHSVQGSHASYNVQSVVDEKHGLIVHAEACLHLLEHAWDFAYENRSNVVDVYVRHLRQKIDEPFGRSSLETVRGAGYRLRAES